MKMLTSAPASKVSAATWAAALTTIALYLIQQVIPAGEALPEAVRIAIGIVITGGITAAVTFAAGWLTPPAARDRVVEAATDPPAVPPQ